MVNSDILRSIWGWTVKEAIGNSNSCCLARRFLRRLMGVSTDVSKGCGAIAMDLAGLVTSGIIFLSDGRSSSSPSSMMEAAIDLRGGDSLNWRGVQGLVHVCSTNSSNADDLVRHVGGDLLVVVDAVGDPIFPMCDDVSIAATAG